MKLDPESRVGSWLLSVAGHLVRWLLLAISSTLRYRIVDGEQRLRELQDDPQAMILSFWHERAFLAAPLVYRDFHRQGIPITILASLSRDGEMVTRMVKVWGIETVRGSATRGGRQALRAIHRAVTRRGSSPIMIPDGPHGPAHEFKVGVAVLAQASGAPILPLGFSAQRYWRLSSWDRLIVPKPFSRVSVVIGEAQVLPKQMSAEQLEDQRLNLEMVINQVTERAGEG